MSKAILERRSMGKRKEETCYKKLALLREKCRVISRDNILVKKRNRLLTEKFAQMAPLYAEPQDKLSDVLVRQAKALDEAHRNISEYGIFVHLFSTRFPSQYQDAVIEYKQWKAKRSSNSETS